MKIPRPTAFVECAERRSLQKHRLQFSHPGKRRLLDPRLIDPRLLDPRLLDPREVLPRPGPWRFLCQKKQRGRLPEKQDQQ
jgi:hypothetical protein